MKERIAAESKKKAVDDQKKQDRENAEDMRNSNGKPRADKERERVR